MPVRYITKHGYSLSRESRPPDGLGRPESGLATKSSALSLLHYTHPHERGWLPIGRTTLYKTDKDPT
jgi:hypothetical protein